MSAKKKLYLAVKERVLQNSSVKHCALFNNQFDNMSEENPFLFPCVFVEFSQLQYVTKSEGYQEADAVIRLHVGFESYKTEELEVLDLLDDLHEDLQGFHINDEFTPLDRNFEGQDTNHDNVIVWQMDYDTLLSDNSGNRNKKLTLTTIGDLEIDRISEKPRLDYIKTT